jgi:hypothetical protein
MGYKLTLKIGLTSILDFTKGDGTGGESIYGSKSVNSPTQKPTKILDTVTKLHFITILMIFLFGVDL